MPGSTGADVLSPGSTWADVLPPGSSWAEVLSPGSSWAEVLSPGSIWVLRKPSTISAKVELIQPGSSCVLAVTSMFMGPRFHDSRPSIGSVRHCQRRAADGPDMTSIDVGDNLEHRCDYPNSIAAATHIAGPHTHS